MEGVSLGYFFSSHEKGKLEENISTILFHLLKPNILLVL